MNTRPYIPVLHEADHRAAVPPLHWTGHDPVAPRNPLRARRRLALGAAVFLGFGLFMASYLVDIEAARIANKGRGTGPTGMAAVAGPMATVAIAQGVFLSWVWSMASKGASTSAVSSGGQDRPGRDAGR